MQDGPGHVRELHVTAFAFAEIALPDLALLLDRNGIAVDVTLPAILEEEPRAGVYLVGFDRASLVHAPAVVDWSRRTSPAPGLVALILDGGIADREDALVAGFDDVVTGPVSHRELTGRLRAVARRLHWRPTQARYGTLVLDPDERTVWNEGGQRHHLTAVETSVLRVLIEARGRAVSYKDMWRAVWEREPVRDSARKIQTMVQRLRHKLGEHTIETIQHVGLRLQAR